MTSSSTSRTKASVAAERDPGRPAAWIPAGTTYFKLRLKPIQDSLNEGDGEYFKLRIVIDSTDPLPEDVTCVDHGQGACKGKIYVYDDDDGSNPC